MTVLETERLSLRHLHAGDAGFIFTLVNDPSWIEFIGDRGVRDLDGARAYIASGPVASYAAHGYGLYLTSLRATSEPIGICGLVRRTGLPDPDIGFALQPAYWSQGYAFEAAAAVIVYARRTLGLSRLLAVTSPGNARSIGLLAKLGFRFERRARLADHAAESLVFRYGEDLADAPVKTS